MHLLCDLGEEGIEPPCASVSPPVKGGGAIRVLHEARPGQRSEHPGEAGSVLCPQAASFPDRTTCVPGPFEVTSSSWVSVFQLLPFPCAGMKAHPTIVSRDTLDQGPTETCPTFLLQTLQNLLPGPGRGPGLPGLLPVLAVVLILL